MKTLLPFLLLALAPVALAQSRPNVVFILADDLGIVDINGYARHFDPERDHSYFETPNLDKLMSQGVVFSQAYANQLCSPSRAAIMTGRIASTIGFTTATPLTKTYYNQGLPVPEGYSPHDAFAHKDNIAGPLAWGNGHSNTALPPGIPTIPSVLAGYDKAFLGKWHLGGHGALGQQPRDHGFTELASFDAGGSAYFNWRQTWNRKNLPYPTMPQPQSEAGNAGEPTDCEFLTDDLTLRAANYLRERAETPEEPFFLYFCHFSVHTPLQAKAETIAHFAEKEVPPDYPRNNATYAAMVKHLDESMGVISETLRETGLDENTILIFTSDNGGVEYTSPAATDNAPFQGGKACLYEGGIRVPLIVHQPGKFEGGQWCSAVVESADFLPTLCELTANETPSKIDGLSFAPLLKSPANEREGKTLYWHYPFNVIVKNPENGFPLSPHSAIREGDFKLIWDWHGPVRLYNIEADPFEKSELSEENPEQAAALLSKLQHWLRKNVETQYFPILNSDYDAAASKRTPFVNRWDASQSE